MKIVTLISADTEWQALLSLFPGDRMKDGRLQDSPYGEWFETFLDVQGRSQPVLFFHGGWGKVAAAGSTQYVIDLWRPDLLVNLGTCGGFEGKVERGTVLLVERTIIYDLYEQMGDLAAHIAHYTTDLDLSWLREPYPSPVLRTLIVSGDRDLIPAEVHRLNADYGAVAGDWESGAIAFVAKRNGVRLLILRGVSDLVGALKGEAYDGNMEVFRLNTQNVMRHLVEVLPAWLAR